MSNREVRNDRRTRLMAKIILGQFAFALLITVISLGVLSYGQGYRFDFSTFRLIKTGVIYLEFTPKDSKISVNGVAEQKYSSFTLNTPPGFYSISVSKDGFTPWLEQFHLDSGSVFDYRNIILFKSDITATKLTDSDKIKLINAPLDVLAANSPGQLLSNEYEIWIDKTLVTRFSEPIGRVIWYPDMAHIVYQQGDEIRIIENNGQNDTLLAKLSSTNQAQFAIGARGTELYYLDGDTYKTATIR